jgi:hypothetical protein
MDVFETISLVPV